jgi:hypothetical protein
MRRLSFATFMCLLLALPRVQANSPAVPATASNHPDDGAVVVPSRLQVKRNALMKQAEADLGAGNADAAAMPFESAVSMAHAPDAEPGLVRSLMQAGRSSMRRQCERLCRS